MLFVHKLRYPSCTYIFAMLCDFGCLNRNTAFTKSFGSLEGTDYPYKICSYSYILHINF